PLRPVAQAQRVLPGGRDGPPGAARGGGGGDGRGLPRPGAGSRSLPPGARAREGRGEGAAKAVPGRAGALLAAFRELAALDVAALRPAKEDGDQCPSLFPGTEGATPGVPAVRRL